MYATIAVRNAAYREVSRRVIDPSRIRPSSAEHTRRGPWAPFDWITGETVKFTEEGSEQA